MKSKMKQNIGDHDLFNECVKITPFLKRIFLRYSFEKGKNMNNVSTISHGIRLAGVALAKKYDIATVEKLSTNYQ
jgi:hypothetical protein